MYVDDIKRLAVRVFGQRMIRQEHLSTCRNMPVMFIDFDASRRGEAQHVEDPLNLSFSECSSLERCDSEGQVNHIIASIEQTPGHDVGYYRLSTRTWSYTVIVISRCQFANRSWPPPSNLFIRAKKSKKTCTGSILVLVLLAKTVEKVRERSVRRAAPYIPRYLTKQQ